MSTLQRAHHIGATIKSLLDGAFVDFELLVRDDGDGNDGTEEAVIEAAGPDPRIRYFRHTCRVSLPEKKNLGACEARGEIIAYCDDHDLFDRQYLAELVQVLDRYPSALYAHCALAVIDESEETVAYHIDHWPELYRGEEWLKFMLGSSGCPVSGNAVVRRSAHERFGLYDCTLGFPTDVELWMRLAYHGDVAYVNKPLIRIRQRNSTHPGARLLTSIAHQRTVTNIRERYIHAVQTNSFRRLAHVVGCECAFCKFAVRACLSKCRRELLGRRMAKS